MAHEATRARALLELATATFRHELIDDLPASKRYLAAMLANALEIAARDLDDLVERSETQLLDALTPAGALAPASDLASLAAAIRSGAISEHTHPDLAAHLLAHVTTELEVRNPRFLAGSG